MQIHSEVNSFEGQKELYIQNINSLKAEIATGQKLMMEMEKNYEAKCTKMV